MCRKAMTIGMQSLPQMILRTRAFRRRSAGMVGQVIQIIDLFDFTKTLPVEWKIVYQDIHNKFFNNITLYHHWLSTNETFIVISKDWSIKFSSD